MEHCHQQFFLELVGSYFVGTYVLAFFGISLPVVQVGGGLIVIATASFGITVELLMLASAAAVVGACSSARNQQRRVPNPSSKIGTWSGSLVIELLGVVPFLCAVPVLFPELAHSALLHSRGLGAVDVALGASELLPAVAILPFMR